MGTMAAVRVAIDLAQVPSRLRVVKRAPLPEGMETLLRVAAGEAEAIETAVSSTGRSAEFLVKSCSFFIEQVLLAPHSDSYRVLGGASSTSQIELRRNMALIARWLHPDVNANTSQTVFAERLTAAWENVKTAERRSLYDQSLTRLEDEKSVAHTRLPLPKVAAKRSTAREEPKRSDLHGAHQGNQLGGLFQTVRGIFLGLDQKPLVQSIHKLWIKIGTQ